MQGPSPSLWESAIFCFPWGYGLRPEVRRRQSWLWASVLSRALSGLAIVRFKLAKNTGLAATFSDMAVKGRVRFVMYLYILACAAAMLALDPVLGIAGLVGALGTFMYYRYMAYKKFGGITGDLAGFFLQVCELVMAVFVVLTQMCLA